MISQKQSDAFYGFHFGCVEYARCRQPQDKTILMKVLITHALILNLPVSAIFEYINQEEVLEKNHDDASWDHTKDLLKVIEGLASPAALQAQHANPAIVVSHGY